VVTALLKPSHLRPVLFGSMFVVVRVWLYFPCLLEGRRVGPQAE